MTDFKSNKQLAEEAKTESQVKRQEIYQKLKGIIVAKLGISEEEITLDSSFSDLGAVSLDSIALIIAFEKAFDISIPEALQEDLTTVKDVLNYLVEVVQ